MVPYSSVEAKGHAVRSISLAVMILFSACGISTFASGVPVQDMSFSGIGIEYSGTVASQTIGGAAYNSFLKAHYFFLRYAPLPYLLLSAGIGVTKYSTDEYDSTSFTATPDAGASFGIAAFSPRIVNFLMLTASAQATLIDNRFGWHRYEAALFDPGAGIIFFVADRFDIETGVKAHLLTGRKKNDFNSTDFSNDNPVRWYFSLTLHSPAEGAYASITSDFSPRIEFNSNGVREAALHFRIGTIIRPFQARSKESIDSYWSYDTLKRQQEKMAKEIRK